MNVSQNYFGLIFTNHAIERMKGRGLRQEWAWEAWKNPDEAVEGKNPGSIEYIKRKDSYKVTVIAKQNEKKEWIVISAWVDPPVTGSIDVGKKEKYHKYQKASVLRKLWLTLREQIGL